VTDTKAIDIIARHALANAVFDIEDSWENYPDIGERDWEWIVHEAGQLLPYPDKAKYDEAYALLSARANVEEARP